MKLLIATADYPNNDGGKAQMFVHVRNKYYAEHNMNVTVLNFAASQGYCYDGIKVVSLKEYKQCAKRYDILVCHAPNIRNHYRFLAGYGKRFPRFVFFFHGHEVVKTNELYPRPYAFVEKRPKTREAFQCAYDALKLKLWHDFFPKVAKKSMFIFVSHRFKAEALKYLKLTDRDLRNNTRVIYNSVGKVFEEGHYPHGSGKSAFFIDNNKRADLSGILREIEAKQITSPKGYDFITIRSNFDGANYCIDVVCSLAEANPERTFLLIGNGRYFDFNPKPQNMTIIKKVMSHGELIEHIDSASCALMPTKRDSHGLMACEMFVYGIPLITSDIPICREVFADCNSEKYFWRNTVKIEIELLESFR